MAWTSRTEAVVGAALAAGVAGLALCRVAEAPARTAAHWARALGDDGPLRDTSLREWGDVIERIPAGILHPGRLPLAGAAPWLLAVAVVALAVAAWTRTNDLAVAVLYGVAFAVTGPPVLALGVGVLSAVVVVAFAALVWGLQVGVFLLLVGGMVVALPIVVLLLLAEPLMTTTGIWKNVQRMRYGP
ncbi:MAG TPA: hypothetical protein VGX28_14750 [Frankiaceae bacterium]|jgi:uncharacterized membrane protein YecN with MAPEG domain|nr:hypothetical protein [Frankiaceae bacterium]